MTREWKPGDVARTIRRGTVARTCHHQWVLLDDGRKVDLDHEPRPLIVIDPENREQVKRLATEYVKTWLGPREVTSPESVNQMQAALREFADPTPPKPEEPTALGAVVEAIYDNRFVRVASCDEGWMRVDERQPALLCTWHDIDAVRVLSEGVTA